MTTFQPAPNTPPSPACERGATSRDTTRRPRIDMRGWGRRRSARDRQGSAIILVIVSIVLMAVLGATFVQVARFERISKGSEHIDIAIDSILNEVAVKLGEDLYANNGDFYNASGRATLNGGGDEPYDYPWTNATAPGFGRAVTFVDGTTGEAQGGIWDDPWLASTGLKDVSNDGSATPAPLEWAHVSDLTGRFLNVGDADLMLLGTNNPGEFATRAADVTDVDINDPRLIDADGDGIGDSFWAYAPAAEIAGKRYVYAIRIIDLSARVNVNVATGGSDTAGNIPVGTSRSPRGDSPTEIDGNFVGNMYGAASGLGAANGTNDFARTTRYRTNSSTLNWGDADQQRRHYWLNSASWVTPALVNLTSPPPTHANYDPARTYGQGDLFELLYRHGLNSTGVTTQLELTMTSHLLRDNSGTETYWGDVEGNEADYMANNPRLALTTASGQMALAPGVTTTANDPTLSSPDSDGDGIRERVLQADINHSSLTHLATVIAETMNAGGTFVATNFAHVPTAPEFGAQLAVNIVDFRDPDNLLSEHNGQFGMEALPFIAEVYAERAYAIDMPLTAPPVDQTYTAAAEPDFAIEIRNPFNRPISLEDVYLSIGTAGATPRNLVTDLGAPATLGVGDYVIFYREASGAGALTAPTRPLDGIPAGNLFALPATENWPDTAGDNQVRLHATAQTAAGTALTWGYSAVDIDETEDNESTPGPVSVPLVPTDPVYFQYSYHGAVDWDMLQIMPNGYDTTGHSDPDTPRTVPAPSAFGSATKNGGVTLASGASWNTGDQQWLFLDKTTSAGDTEGRIPYVADVLTIPVVGPKDPSATGDTLAEAIDQSAATRLDQFMIDYRRATAPAVDATVDVLNVNHATLLTARLTTHNPAYDGEDLNGDGSGATVGLIDRDEVFVPGKINLNTATYDILRSALPFPSAAMRDDIAQRIIDHRTGASRPASTRAAPGVAYIGELYESVQLDADTHIGTVGGYGAWDWNNYQDNATSDGVYSTPDNITGDREEDLMLAKWLDEVCSTRSDVFAVYMVVQGYPAGNFGAGAVESARVVAVFSRANVRQVGDKAQLIAVRRVE